LGRFARPRVGFGSRRLLRLYYIPQVHNSNRIYSAISRLIVFKRPNNVYERRAFGMWLSSAILPHQVRENIQTSVLEARRRPPRVHVRN
ncbi:MAG: hypothetical protein QXL60_06480, partial [Nitrososphaerota archaeon]